MWHARGEGNTYRILAGETETMRSLGRTMRIWEDNFKVDFKTSMLGCGLYSSRSGWEHVGPFV
jgi:hypothetical protein